MSTDADGPETSKTDASPGVSTPSALPAAGLIAGALIGGTAIAWLVSRLREDPLAQRTRERLAPRQSEAVVPSAADIHVR